jgi:hypothetical protein
VDNRFLLALLFTVSAETAVLIAGFHLFFTQRRPSLLRVLFAGFFASSWSLPYLWFLVPRLVSGKAYLPVGECFVIIGEAVILRYVFELRYIQCVILSVICNLASIVAGVALVRILE